MSTTREALNFLNADRDNASRIPAAQQQRLAEEQLRAQEIAHLNQVMNQNNDLIAKAVERENVINTLSARINQLVDINKAQAQQIEELKLENENLKSMCGFNDNQPSTPQLSSPRI